MKWVEDNGWQEAVYFHLSDEPAKEHLATYRHQATPLWAYYCNAQKIAVSNRFFDMPSARNRIIGYQLFQYGISGFLHWGYNFWYSQYSRQLINPFQVTVATGTLPSGDAFLVYQGAEEPLPSLRLKVFHYALQDQRALAKLAALTSLTEVQAWLSQEAGQLTFDNYPTDARWQLLTREKINGQISCWIKGKAEFHLERVTE